MSSCHPFRVPLTKQVAGTNYANMRLYQVFTQLMQRLSTQVDRLIVRWMIRAMARGNVLHSSSLCDELHQAVYTMEMRVWNHAMQCRRAAGEFPQILASIWLMLSALTSCVGSPGGRLS